MSDDLLRALEGETSTKKPFDHTDYLRRFLRRRWWVLSPLFVLGLAGYMASRLWPLPYRSEALLLAELPTVAERYVAPNAQVTLQSRCDNITQQILSEARLRALITRFGGNRQEQNGKSLDGLDSALRKSISIEPISVGTPANQGEVRISFQSSDPYLAQSVVAALTDDFIAEDTRVRAQQAAGTEAFLDNELKQAEKNLAEQDRLVLAFKQRHAGQLPEQQQMNLVLASTIESELKAANAALDHAQQERAYLNSMQGHYRNPGAAPGGELGGQSDAAVTLPVLDTYAEASNRELNARLEILKMRYTEKHPEIVRI